jgi:hypothetical protein
MEYWTFAEIKEKIENDLDLQEEPDILSDGELMGYVNDAIDVCEQQFIKLPDYFLAKSTITLADGTQDYDLPADIYATKIRMIMKGDEYEVKLVRDLKKVPFIAANDGTDYSYILLNNAGSAPKIRIIPTPSAAETLDIYYTRNATRITSESDEIDIPEAMGYIITYIKMRIHEKEKQFSLVQKYEAELMKQEQLLLDALAERVDDESQTIEPDIGIYQDMMDV